MRRRVVISGMGALSSAGGTLAEARRKFAEGTCCLSPINDPGIVHLKARYAGLVPDFDAAKAGVPGELRRFDRHVQMAFIAASEALTEARVRPAAFGPRMGLVFSTCSGPMLLIEAHYERILLGDPRLTREELFAKRYYSGARLLAHAFGIQGLATTVVTACTAGTSAIALAADLIRCGLLDAALAGGSDAFSTSTLAGFDGLKATTDGKCAPFSKPFGLNLGEAAAFVFLETPESARERRASVHAEVAGSGMSNDAYHCSSPEPAGRGLAAAMQRALTDASLTPEQISYINAHGTGTEANDKAETRAIRRVFGPRAEQIPISSTKSMVGHCLGAAGVIEAIASIACAEMGVLPPTANFCGPREGCTLDYVPDTGRKWATPRTFLSNNLAFGGHNASLVISFPERDLPSRSKPGSAIPAEDTIYLTACGLVSSVGLGSTALQEAIRHERSGVQPVPLNRTVQNRHSGQKAVETAQPLRASPGTVLKHGVNERCSKPEYAQVGSVDLASSLPIRAGLVSEETVKEFDRRLDLRHMDRSSRWATVATRLALREAALADHQAAPADVGLFLNLAAGPSGAESEFLTSFLSHHRQVSQLVAFPFIVPCSVTGNVCRALRLTGHNLTLSIGPGAGLLGLGPALAALRGGHTEALLTGAVDELSERILTDNFLAEPSPEKVEPPGEGAAVLLLETGRHARARGARPLAAICGAAFSTEVEHCCQPDGSGAVLEGTVRQALDEAGITPEQIGGLCLFGPQPRFEELFARVCPAWAGRVASTARHTGLLEGAQPLFDVVAALQGGAVQPEVPRYILAIVSSSLGANAAVVFRTGQVA